MKYITEELIEISKNIYVNNIKQVFIPNEDNVYNLMNVPIKLSHYGIYDTFHINIYSSLSFVSKIKDYYYDIDTMKIKLNDYKPKHSDERVVIEYYAIRSR